LKNGLISKFEHFVTKQSMTWNTCACEWSITLW